MTKFFLFPCLFIGSHQVSKKVLVSNRYHLDTNFCLNRYHLDTKAKTNRYRMKDTLINLVQRVN